MFMGLTCIDLYGIVTKLNWLSITALLEAFRHRSGNRKTLVELVETDKKREPVEAGTPFDKLRYRIFKHE
tara:strand:+ start:1456 stop:1665 length:210 start_codon:yes stop_codon:yes gene_type:complete